MKRVILFLVCLSLMASPVMAKVILASNGAKVASFGVEAYDKEESVAGVTKYRNYAFINYEILKDGTKIGDFRKSYLIGEHDTSQGAMQAIEDFKSQIPNLKSDAQAVIQEYTNP